MSDYQETLFSERTKRRLWLERVVIPRFEREVHGKRRLARTNTIKHLLRVLESHARNADSCRVSRSLIAREMNVSPKTVSRCIADCEACGLLTVERSCSPLPDAASVYTINWTAVGEAILADPRTANQIQVQYRPAAHATSGTPEHAGNDPGQLDRDSSQLVHNPGQLDRDSSQVDRREKNCTSLTRARLKPCLSHGNPMVKQPCGNGVLKNDRKTGWPFEITAEDLGKISKVQTLWEHWIAQPFGGTLEMRITFFTLARVVKTWAHGRAGTEGEIKNPGALFTTQLKKAVRTGMWPGTLEDEDAARRAIEIADGRR